MNGTCKTCKFWCDGVCEHITMVEDDRNPKAAVIDVYVADDHNLGVKFRTGPDFGCILHAERKEET